MTWMQAWLRAGIIFVYFVLATVLLPELVVGLGPVSRASNLVRDVAVLAVWGGGFLAGLFLLRSLQSRGRI